MSSTGQWGLLRWTKQPSGTVGSLEWEKGFLGGTIQHKVLWERTEDLPLENVICLVVRAACHVMLDLVPEQGLAESWEKLKQIKEFYIELAEHESEPPRLTAHSPARKPVKARLGKRYERPKISLPEAE
jgi:hypothetical protein